MCNPRLPETLPRPLGTVPNLPARTWITQSAPGSRTARRARPALNISLHYAEQLRRKGKQVTISLPSATTARDILPTRPGETRPRTSHRDIAGNNSRKLQQLGTQVKINVDTANAPQRLQHEAEAAARSGDLRAHVRVPGRAVHAIPLWDELRTWDPGD